MKRFIKVFLVLGLVSAFGYWGYKQLNKTASLIGKIHINADSALKIGVQEIKETLVLDALTAPGYYLDKASFKDSDDKEKSEKGINILPYSIIFYTVPEVKNTFFGTFLISDTDAFEVYIVQELAKKEASIEYLENEGYRFVKIDKSKLALAWNSEKLVVAFSPELSGNALQKVFKDVLTDGKTIDDKDNALIKALADSNDHLVFVQDKSSVAINFEDGKAVVAGSIRTLVPQKFQPEVTTEALTEPSLQLYFDANFENTANKKEWINRLTDISFFTKNDLNVSEVLDRTNGFFSLSITGNITQVDTVITYEYDDNFEKVETRSLQEKQVPKTHINLGGENESLKDYLRSKNAVNAKGIFELFPLYQIHVKDDSMNTVFDTFKGRVPIQEKRTNSFFGFQIDFKKLSQDMSLPMVENYIENLKNLKLYAAQKEGNRIAVNGELIATDPSINILSQLSLPKQQDSVQ